MPDLRKVVLGLEANLLSEWFAFWKGARRHAVSPSLPIWGSRYSATVTCCSMQGNFVIPNSWFYVIFPSWYKSLRRFSYNQLPILWRELSAFQKSSSHTLTFLVIRSRSIFLVTFSTRSGPHLATPLSLGQTWNGWNPRRCRNIFDTIDSNHWSDR